MSSGRLIFPFDNGRYLQTLNVFINEKRIRFILIISYPPMSVITLC